jgi:hypothetical protein
MLSKILMNRFVLVEEVAAGAARVRGLHVLDRRVFDISGGRATY